MCLVVYLNSHLGIGLILSKRFAVLSEASINHAITYFYGETKTLNAAAYFSRKASLSLRALLLGRFCTVEKKFLR